MYNILVINPGSTSTKVAVYRDEEKVFGKTISHTADELKQFAKITDQYDFRKQHVLDTLRENGFDIHFDAVVARGGIAKAVEGGVYQVNDKMTDDMRNARHQHACDLGCIIAKDIADSMGSPSFVADTGTTDELCDYARISGSPLIPRICIWHALNQRAIARRFAKSIGKRYEDLNLIICHLGGGISVAAHDHGRAIDVNNSLDGEGPFSPERAGTLPAHDLIDLCFSGKYTQAELIKMLAGQGGLAAHLGTTDMMEIDKRIEQGDKHAELIVNAMIYHTAKAIAAEGAVLYGKVDAIIFTGGIARDNYVIDRLSERVKYLAPIHIFPGEDELEALALNSLGVLRGELVAKEY